MRAKTQLIKYLLSDFFASAFAWLAFNFVRYYLVAQQFGSLSNFLRSHDVIRGQILIPIGWIILFYFSGYYNRSLEKSRLSEFFTTLQSTFLGTIVIFFVVVLKNLPDSFRIYYEQFSCLFLFSFTFVYIGRFFITQDAAKKIKNRVWTIKSIILGDREIALKTKKMLDKSSGTLKHTILGFVQTKPQLPIQSIDSGIPILGNLDDLKNIIEQYGVEELIIAIDSEDKNQLLHLLYSLYQYKLPIKLPLSETLLLTGGGVKFKTITGTPLVDITENNFSDAEKNIKFACDKVISIFVLLLLSPVYLYLAIRVKMDSPGPIFYRQERIGFRGKPFTIYKFRTMMNKAEKEGPSLSSIDDKRITKYGKTMRKFRLDELPQFWNVFKGDMSLVGPRPERMFFINQIVEKAPYYYLLHNVRPGITSWGMVKYGYASNVDQMIERMQYDILYYENMSLAVDMKILIYTIKTIATGKGI